ncbi:uncharacterized protein B0I36DRAFT_19044 [Microdochium trichocladiopsis]|uniref:Uncharacterized protein n=1 Tax=Microdochium trichocladiopsis TaxID=1682393 RepID=A0A9P8YJD2_9PEZI|nr:uncharacterized protein B0I36DRAFT_19044 [Microdochium trichocladiopsis]KAH7041078.1 hypothetical protein B0I36DRAFT_19044 [Microdochium trichocladiopsis]
MDKSLALARIARGVRSSRAQRTVASLPSLRPQCRPTQPPVLAGRHMSSGPSVVQPSFWKSMIPKPFRRKTGHHPEFLVAPKKPRSKEWNPATFFIVIFLFIGSMSIQMIALRRDFSAFTRRADVRIGLLREVVEKLQRGEPVDVEKALGTGDAQKELEWEQVLREIERDDILKNTQKSSRSRSAPSSSGSAAASQSQSAPAESKQDATQSEPTSATDSGTKTKAASFSSFF